MGPCLRFKCQVLKCHVTPENLTPDTLLQSGRRDSNPRISAWKADALPLGDSRVRSVFYHKPRLSLRDPIGVEAISALDQISSSSPQKDSHQRSQRHDQNDNRQFDPCRSIERDEHMILKIKEQIFKSEKERPTRRQQHG
jgi:hypothetical protein